MAVANPNVTRWYEEVDQMIRRYQLLTPEPWMVLAQIHTESRGEPAPDPTQAPHGILQMYEAAATDCGVDISDIDGLQTPREDAKRAIDCWGKLQKRYTGVRAPVWDYPLMWWGGSGTLSEARNLRSSGSGFWEGWKLATQKTLGESFTDYLFDYAKTWLDAAWAYWEWESKQEPASV